jgi:hypothetical protein
LDNGPYVAPGEAVVDHLRRALPNRAKATLVAVDGATILGVKDQVARLPNGITHIVISIGGNDALGHQDFLRGGANSVAQVLRHLAEIGEDFERRYDEMLRTVLREKIPTTVCTIYYPNFPDPVFQRLAVTASTIFNDVILRVAFRAGVPVMDLRLIFDEPGDYANPIEPSSTGGRKIVESLLRVLAHHDFSRRRSAVYL